jgi:LuxR family maltose regulon positive regulatory protein
MPTPLLDRPRLNRRLDDAARSPLVVVSGMAGAGKSTAVRQWLRASIIDHEWIGLDARDNDASRFWSRFASATGAGGWAARGAVGRDDLDELVESIAGSPDRIVVLDDVHFVIDPEVVDQLDYVLDRLPARLRVVLISRSSTPVPLGRFRAAGMVGEIGLDELAFTREEIAELLASGGELVDRVAATTNGLAVAVALRRGLALQDDAVGVDRAATPGELAEYLAEEVLAALPDDVQRFALESAVLDPVGIDSANTLLEIDDSAARLAFLAARGLATVAESGSGWSMHAVVRDFLLGELDRRSPERAQQLHARASGIFETTDPVLAITHALAAEDPERAVALIECSLPELQGVLYSTQLRWLQALPAGTIESRPVLCAHAALVAAYERRFDLAERWLRKRDSQEPESIEELGALTMQYVVLGDLPRLREVASRLHAVANEDSTLWGLGNGALAGALHSTGDAEGALAVMAGMLRPVAGRPAQFLPLQSTARAVVTRLLTFLGRYEQAHTALEDLREWVAEASAVEGFSDLGAVDWAEATLALAEGDSATASGWADAPAPEASLGLPFLEVWLQTDFAAARAAARDERGARRALYRVQTSLSRFADPGLLEERLREAGAPFGVGPLGRRMPSTEPVTGSLTEREATVLGLLDSDLSLREISDHLFLSPNTVKAHVRAIYRKLEVNSRHSAVRMLRDGLPAV